MSPPDVDLGNTLLPKHQQVLHSLGVLANIVDPNKWCVVGGLMVLIAGQETGNANERTEQTKDGDIVVDLVDDEQALTEVFKALSDSQYKVPPEAFDGTDIARCTMMSGDAFIDILGPEDAPKGSLVVGEDIQSIGIPGGRRALEVAEMVTVTWGDEGIAEFRVPLLYGAIAVKAHACHFPRTMDQDRHIQDVAFLLSTVSNPRELRDGLGVDAELIEQLLDRLNDDGDAAWRYLTEPERRSAQTALDFL